MTLSPTSWPAGPFNGGTITNALTIAPTNPNTIPLSIEASWNAIAVDFLRVLNTDTSTRLFAVDVQGQMLTWRHTSETDKTIQSLGSSVGLFVPGFQGQGATGARQLGFYDTAPISIQTGVPVTAAGIHAALVALGLITA